MKVKAVILASCLLWIAVMSIGCGKLSIPTGDGGSIAISKDGELSVKGKDGEEGSISISDSKLPKDFPKEIPIPKGATIEGSLSAKSDGKKSFTVTLLAKQSVEDLTKLYGNYMNKAAYEDLYEWGDHVFWQLSGSKDEYKFIATISKNDDAGTTVILSYSPEE